MAVGDNPGVEVLATYPRTLEAAKNVEALAQNSFSLTLAGIRRIGFTNELPGRNASPASMMFVALPLWKQEVPFRSMTNALKSCGSSGRAGANPIAAGIPQFLFF